MDYKPIHDALEHHCCNGDRHHALSLLLEQSQNSVTVVNRDGIIEYANANLLRRYQLSRAQAQQLHWRAVVSGASTIHAQLPEIIQRVIEEGQIWKGEIAEHRPTGDWLYEQATIIPIRNSDGAITHTAYIAENITSRKQAERLLAMQLQLSLRLGVANDLDALLTLCLDTLIDITELECGAIYLTDCGTGELRMVHQAGLSESFIRAVASFDEHSPQNRLVAQGTPIYTCFEKLDLPREDARRVAGIREGLKAMAVVPIKHRDRIIACLNLASRDKNTIAGFLRDAIASMTPLIGESIARKRAEEETKTLEAMLVEQQKLESIGTFAAGVAHEINNPLLIILNSAQLISDKLGRDHPVRRHAQNIILESERVSLIVKDLLSFARRAPVQTLPNNIKDIIDRTLSLVGSSLDKDQIAVKLQVPADLPLIDCRGQQIQQVLLNLIVNARDALNERYPGFHENKILEIRAKEHQKQGRRCIRTTVADQGIGISEELQPRVFDPFYTTKSQKQGTGLGLSVSHGLVHDHGGELLVESLPGELTQFHMDLCIEVPHRSTG